MSLVLASVSPGAVALLLFGFFFFLIPYLVGFMGAGLKYGDSKPGPRAKPIWIALFLGGLTAVLIGVAQRPEITGLAAVVFAAGFGLSAVSLGVLSELFKKKHL